MAASGSPNPCATGVPTYGAGTTGYHFDGDDDDGDDDGDDDVDDDDDDDDNDTYISNKFYSSYPLRL